MSESKMWWSKLCSLFVKKETAQQTSQSEMVHNLEGLSETLVKEIMIPRIDVSAIDIEASLHEVFDLLEKTYHSRYPVYKETVDNVVGVLYTKDLLVALMRKQNTQDLEWARLLRKPYFVPESKRVNTLLSEFKKRHVHIAIAVDEYGGVSGIVCLEDIFEEIIGDIQDEFEKMEQEDVVHLGENEYLCDARVLIEDLNEQLNLNLPSDGFDTLGGFVFDLLGRIPSSYEQVTYEHAKFIVQQVEGLKIKTIKVIKEDGKMGESHESIS